MKVLLSKARAGTSLIIGLLLCCLSMIGSNVIQTDFGHVDVIPLKIETSTGHTLAANLFVPDTATPENPAPTIVDAHGWFTNKETHDAFTTEYSRRGYVVLALDLYGHGDSEILSQTDQMDGAIGTYDAIKYVATLPFVDRSRIGATGHSNGGWSVNLAVQLDNEAPEQLISNVYLVSKDADYVDADDNYINTYGSRNTGIFAGAYDDYFFVEYQFSKAFIEGKINGNPITSTKEFLSTDIAKSFVLFGQDPAGMTTDVEAGHVYEETVDGAPSTRVIDTANQIHIQGFFSRASVGDGVTFFERVMPSDNPIPSTSQIWPWKAGFGLIGLAGFTLVVTAVAMLLARKGYFAVIGGDSMPSLRPATKDRAGRIWLIATVLINMIIPIINALVLIKLRWGYGVGVTMSQQLPSFYAIWGTLNTIALGATLLIWYQTYGKKHGISMRDIRATISWDKLWKTLIVALVAVGAGFALVYVTQFVCVTDFRFWQWAIRPVDFPRFLMILKYAPALILFMTVNSVMVNCLNYDQLFGKRRGLNTFWWALITCAPALLIVVYGYGSIILTGYNPNLAGAAETPGWLFNAVPILFISVFMTRKIFRETENPYLGGFINGLVMSILNSTTALTLLGTGF